MRNFYLFGLVALSSYLSVSAYTVSFSKGQYSDGTAITYSEIGETGCPDGWSRSGNGTVLLSTIQPYLFEGENCLSVDFQTATGNAIFYMNEPLPRGSVFSDVISVSFRTYIHEYKSKVDGFQIVASSNKTEWIDVGTSMSIRSSSTKGWFSYEFDRIIGGISKWNDVYIGIKAISAGRSGTLGYISEFSINSSVGAIITDFKLESDGVELPALIVPMTNNIVIRAELDCQPNDESVLAVSSVSGIIVRNGTVVTNELLRQGDSNCFVSSAILPNLDADETVDLYVFSIYSSNEENNMGEPLGGNLYRFVSSTNHYSVGKLGSVWVNEFDGDSVEFMGTTNRTYIGGWQLQLVDGEDVSYAEINEPFNFTTNMVEQLVGIETRVGLKWKDASGSSVSIGGGGYELRLLNSAGKIEHSAQVTLPGRYGMSGEVAWPNGGLSYDWTGTATNGMFSWGVLDTETIGCVNEGQKFKTKVYAQALIRTLVVDGVSTSIFETATVSLAVTNMLNELTNTVCIQTKPTTGGIADFDIEGYSSATQLNASVSVDAFGWVSNEEAIEIGVSKDVQSITPTKKDVCLTPSLAEDDFSDGVADYWRNSGSLSWFGSIVTRDNNLNPVLCVDASTIGAPYTNAALHCKNHLGTRGKRVAAVSFDLFNGKALTSSSRYDEVYVEMGTNETLAGESITTMKSSSKNISLDINTWRNCLSIMELPSGFGDQLWVQLMCLSKGRTGERTYVDNLRIAFQDMAMITNVVRTGTETNPGFNIEVEPWCGEGQIVSNVSVQIVMEVDSGSRHMVITNYAKANGMITNDLSQVTTFTVSSETISMNLAKAFDSSYTSLRAHDKVRYWAQVNYFADSRDPNPEKEWETRYFPDNATIDGEGRWTVEGEYGIDTNSVASNFSFDIPGDPISMNGDFGLSKDDVTTVSFGFRAYDAAGVSNVTATISAPGEVDKTFQFATNGVVCYDNEVSTGGLVANTEYTVTITGSKITGEPLDEAKFHFTTFPVLTGATLKAVSTNEVVLIVNGRASGYDNMPDGWDGWTLSESGTEAWTWIKSELEPNSKVEAKGMICATNTNGGVVQRTDSIPVTPDQVFTLAASAAKAPVIAETNAVSIAVKASEDYVAVQGKNIDGNPTNTEYAILVRTSSRDYATIVTNGTAEVWKTLAEWRDDAPIEIKEPTIDLIATNYLSFVTRNLDGEVTSNAVAVVTNWYDMTVGIIDEKADQAKRPFEPGNEYGNVKFCLELFDPVKSQDATVDVEYVVSGHTWTNSIAVSFDEQTLRTTNLCVWTAWEDVSNVLGNAQLKGEFDYSLRARVRSGKRSSEWTKKVFGTLDFAPPAELTIIGAPEEGTAVKTTSCDLTFSAKDTNKDIEYGWVLTGATGSTTNGAGSSASITGLKDDKYELHVTATDIMGNVSETNRHWTVDTTRPTAEIDTTTRSPFNAAKVPMVVTVEFSEPVTGFTAGDVVVSNCTVGAVEGSGATYTFKVWPIQDGEVAVQINDDAVRDLAGNENEASSWLTRTYDNTAPTEPVVSGLPGALTNVKAFTLTASGTTDAHGFTYHWIFGGDAAAGETYDVVTETDGAYEVLVYAVDEAGNSSTTNSVRWTLDATVPTEPVASGLPSALTNVKAFTLTASGTTDAHGFTYHWIFGGDAAAGETYDVVTDDDGDYEVGVYAVDAAGNSSTTNTVRWTLDATAPTEPTVTGLPGELTNVKKFTLTASGTTDAHGFTYHWIFGEATATGESYDVETETDGAYEVGVYAVDAAGNSSTTNTVRWTLDATAPTEPVVSGLPGALTNEKAFTLTASGTTDAHAFTYHWIFGEATATGESYDVETETDGAYEVLVYAVDAAGNSSTTNTVRWTLDATAPTEPTVTGLPGELTNVTNFTLTASGTTDDHAFTYHWIFGEATATGESYDVETETDGAYEVLVYAVDAAGNSSTTNTVSWTLDVTAPTEPVVSGLPVVLTDEKVTNVKEFTLTASGTTDAHGFTYHWIFGEDAAAGETYDVVTDDDGDYEVLVYAVDAAGNSSTTNTVSWTLDATAPTGLKIAGDPAAHGPDGRLIVTNGTAFSFVAIEAIDAHLPLTYRWATNGVDAAETSAAFSGDDAKEGTNTVSVWAIDAVGNASLVSASRTWVVDLTAPEKPNVITRPKLFTNDSDFTIEVDSTDATAIAYHWTLNGSEVGDATSTYSGTVKDEGEYSVGVYATDEAENVSETNTVSWTYDITKPEVDSIESYASDPSDTNGVFTVRVTFNEAVTGFSADSITVSNGTVIADSVALVQDSDGKVYTADIALTSEALAGPLSVGVSIEEGAVTDLAGNGNVASDKLTKPTARLDYRYPEDSEPFNDGTWRMNVTFSEPVVEFTNGMVTVSDNAKVNKDPKWKTNGSYEVTIEPQDDGPVTVQIVANAVVNSAGNGNVASMVLTRVCDTHAPSNLVVSCTANGSTITNGETVTARELRLKLVADAQDATAITYWWRTFSGETEEGRELSCVVTEPGRYEISVYAADAAVNYTEQPVTFSFTFIKDTTPLDVEFGGGICVRVDPETGATNDVRFTSIEFKPGGTSEFKLSGFAASSQEPSPLQMYFVVCDTLGGDVGRVQVESATFNAETSELTVTLPANALLDKDNEPCKSFFILGIDNKGE